MRERKEIHGPEKNPYLDTFHAMYYGQQSLRNGMISDIYARFTRSVLKSAKFCRDY